MNALTKPEGITVSAADGLELAWFDELASIEAEEHEAAEERDRDCMLTVAQELR